MLKPHSTLNLCLASLSKGPCDTMKFGLMSVNGRKNKISYFNKAELILHQDRLREKSLMYFDHMQRIPL